MDPAELMQDIATIFRTCRRLEEASGLPFGPDGFTLGSAGEVIAAWVYDLELETSSSNAGYDAVTREESPRTVQIKATSKGPGGGVGWRDLSPRPDVLLVVRLDPATGTVTELFNGPYDIVWTEYLQHRPVRAANNTRGVRLNAILELANEVPTEFRLARVHPFPTF